MPHTPEPKPEKGRRTEETKGGLMMAARRFMRRTSSRVCRQFREASIASFERTAPALPASAPDASIYAAATIYLSDTLDSMNPFWDHSAEDLFQDDFQHPEQNQLSLHL